MALFAPKLNPADVRLEYTSRIEAVAYPSIRRSATAGKMTHGEPEEYSYFVDAAVKSYYRAEGHLRCPGLDNLVFMFETENPLDHDGRLALGEGSQRTSGPLGTMPLHYFQLRNIGEPKRRKGLADSIIVAIQKEFLQIDPTPPFKDLQSPPYVRSLLVSVGQAARVEYQRNLEQQLRENPRAPVFPQQYRYDIDGKVFDAKKLVKA